MKNEWVKLNPLTMCYETPDGTAVPVELSEKHQCLADVLYISWLRAEQRKKIAKPRVNPNTQTQKQAR